MNRKTTLKALAAGLVLSLWGGGALAAYNGSAHDFSGSGWSGGENCTVCHTPHGTATAGAATSAPLWSHEVSTTTYTPYSSITGTMDATLANPLDLSGISRLCMSCHDGTVGLDNFGGITGGTEPMPAANLVGTDLSNDHPVGFAYSATTATDLEFEPNATVYAADLTFGADAATATVECVSCHDVHGTSGNVPFLRVSKANLCISCHTK